MTHNAFESLLDANIMADSIKMVVKKVEIIVSRSSRSQSSKIFRYRLSLRSRLFCTNGQFGSTRSWTSWEKVSPKQSNIKNLILKYLNCSIRIYCIKQLMVFHQK